MRVLAFTNTPLDPTLGSGKAVLRWSEGLRARGHEVRVVTADEITLPRRMRRGWVWRLAFGACWYGPGRGREFKPDVVEFYGAEFGWLAQHWRKQPRRPLLVAHLNGLDALAFESMHPGQLDPGRTKPRWRALDVSCFSSVDRIAALCPADVNYIVERGWQPRAHCGIVEHGVDAEFLAAPPVARDQAVAFTGSWIPRKGTDTLARVMGPLLLEDSTLRLDILGAAPATPEAVRSLFPAAARERVVVHGRMTSAQIAPVLFRAKVFLFPSLYEGYGLGLSEAMAAGCAAVTTPTGLGSALRDGAEAMICPFRDEETMRAAVRRLLDDDTFRARLAAQGRARLAAQTWPQQAAELERLYQHWLIEHRAENPAREA
jgi:glycosyltransferase involved in cell wall biosynthesis